MVTAFLAVSTLPTPASSKKSAWTDLRGTASWFEKPGDAPLLHRYPDLDMIQIPPAQSS